jgi:glycosyltransferase involved in cell wall biosynthesis
MARYTSTLASMLGRLLGPENVHVLVLLAYGVPEDAPRGYRILTAVTDRLRVFDKVRFAAKALQVGRKRYSLTICNHVCLAPIAAVVRLVFGTPYWVACHDAEAWAGVRLSEAAALKGADLILPVSQFTARKACEANGIPEAKVKVLYNAIPDDFAKMLLSGNGHASCASTAKQGEKILLSVGSLSKGHAYKGFDRVIEALPALLRLVPRLRYVIVGEGDNRESLEKLAGRLGVRERVTFAGGVTQEQLAKHYHACDVFVLPSGVPASDGRWQGEGFGRVYVEAALAGKPVVGSRNGGAAEAVLDGKTGFVIDPCSHVELTGALLTLLQNAELSARMGQAGQQWAVENFTQNGLQASLRELLGLRLENAFTVEPPFRAAHAGLKPGPTTS